MPAAVEIDRDHHLAEVRERGYTIIADVLSADEVGTLEPGKWADFAIWNISEPAELVYWLGFNPLHARVWRGTSDL